MKKKILGIILIASMLLVNIVTASADSYFTGEGTKESPYLIQSAADIAQLSSLTNAAATAAEYANKYYKLTADIDMQGISYKPISWGTSMTTAQGARFTGTFDGGGHIIKNISIPAAYAQNYGATAGFIGILGTDGTVKNLGIEDMNIMTGSASYMCIGGIAGDLAANGMSIDNCYVRGMTVTGISAASPAFVGGLVGRTAGNAGTITNCYTAALSFTVTNDPNHLAGIIGACGNVGYSAANCYTTHSKIEGWAAATNSYITKSSCYASVNPDSFTADGLGSAFKENMTVKNDGLPLLSWESTEGYPLKQGAAQDPNFTGAGTIEEPFEIDSAEKLVKLATLTNDANQGKYASKYYRLTADLDMMGIVYKPISYGTSMTTAQGTRFTGTIDGGGHIIKNITIPASYLSGYGATAGLIGILGTDGTVKNLGIENITITTGNATYMCIGGIAGSLATDGMSIENCYVKGMTVNGATAGSPVFAGGVTGRTVGNAGTITNCYTTEFSFDLPNTNNSGGIIGSCGNTGYSAENCYTTYSKVEGWAAATNSYINKLNCHASITPEKQLQPSVLGDAFEEDESLINQGMPILLWEYDVAHPETAYYTVKANDSEIDGDENVSADAEIIIEFDRNMNTETFAKIGIFKADEVLGADNYIFETLTSKKISIKLKDAGYGARYAIKIPKTVQSEKDGNGKSAKADAKSVEFRIAAKPKAVTVSEIKVNGNEDWTPDFTAGTAINVEANAVNASGAGTQSAALLVTVFSDGIMKYAAMDSAATGAAGETLSVSFNMPDGLNLSNAKMYVMVWDSITKMNAMSVEKVFTSN